VKLLCAFILAVFVLIAVPVRAGPVSKVAFTAFSTSTPQPTFERVVIAFRNPLPTSKQHSTTRQTMYIMRIVDAWNSAYHAQHRVTGWRWQEHDDVMKSFSHNGLLGYAVGFALEDIVMHTAARTFHLGPKSDQAIDGYQAYSSLYGIMNTEAQSR
jgi:hypothetical protein